MAMHNKKIQRFTGITSYLSGDKTDSKSVFEPVVLG